MKRSQRVVSDCGRFESIEFPRSSFDATVNDILAGARGSIARALLLALGFVVSATIAIGGLLLIASIPPEAPAMIYTIPPPLGYVPPGTRALMIGAPVEVAVPRADSSGIYDYVPLAELQRLVAERQPGKQ